VIRYSIGRLLVHAALWTAVRRVVDRLPFHIVVIVVAVAVGLVLLGVFRRLFHFAFRRGRR
jgi:hypothetical protein